MTRVIATFNEKSVDEADPKDCSVNSDYVIPKILPQHFDKYVYTFGSNPGDGTTTMFSIGFDEFDYLPMGMVLMEETTDNAGSFTFLVVDTLIACTRLDFSGGVPPKESSTLQQIYLELDRSDKKLYIKYYKNTTLDAGYAGTTCPTINVNGKTFTFRYYIFVEGDDDEDMIAVSKTI